MKDLLEGCENVLTSFVCGVVSSFGIINVYNLVMRKRIYNEQVNYVLNRKDKYISTSISRDSLINDYPLVYSEKEREIVETGIDNKPVKKFLNIIKNNFDNDSLDYLYNNLVNLELEPVKKLGSYVAFKVFAHYNPEHNVIAYADNSDSSINHELFHVASTIFLNNGYIYTGFSNYYLNNSIGVALNEGYTELLTERYFGKNKDNSYTFEKIMAWNMEKLIGKEKMQSLYMKADLSGLIMELSKYGDEKNIIEIIRKMDYILELQKAIKPRDKRSKFISNLTEEVQYGLVDLTINKTVQEGNTCFDFQSIDSFGKFKIFDEEKARTMFKNKAENKN